MSALCPLHCLSDECLPEEDACSPSRCDMLMRQINTLAHALGGLAMNVWKWAAPSDDPCKRAALADLFLQYIRPCVHIDHQLEPLVLEMMQHVNLKPAHCENNGLAGHPHSVVNMTNVTNVTNLINIGGKNFPDIPSKRDPQKANKAVQTDLNWEDILRQLKEQRRGSRGESTPPSTPSTDSRSTGTSSSHTSWHPPDRRHRPSSIIVLDEEDRLKLHLEDLCREPGAPHHILA